MISGSSFLFSWSSNNSNSGISSWTAQRAEEVRHYHHQMAMRSEQSNLQIARTAIVINSERERQEHEARMKKAADIEAQVLAVEKLKVIAEEEVEKLRLETEELEAQLAIELKEHEAQIASLDAVHEDIILEQETQLTKLKEKTCEQEIIVEKSQEGLEKVTNYAKQFSELQMKDLTIGE